MIWSIPWFFLLIVIKYCLYWQSQQNTFSVKVLQKKKKRPFSIVRILWQLSLHIAIYSQRKSKGTHSIYSAFEENAVLLVPVPADLITDTSGFQNRHPPLLTLFSICSLLLTPLCYLLPLQQSLFFPSFQSAWVYYFAVYPFVIASFFGLSVESSFLLGSVKFLAGCNPKFQSTLEP